MNWLHPLIEKIHACKAFPVDERAALVLAANELGAICDQVKPSPPMPDVLAISGRLQLRWGDEQRWLTLQYLEVMVLTMQDKGSQHRIDKPPHDEVRRAVSAFFEAKDG